MESGEDNRGDQLRGIGKRGSWIMEKLQSDEEKNDDSAEDEDDEENEEE